MTAVYEVVSKEGSPVSLSDMKSYLKISTTADDDLIQYMIDAATEYGESYTGRDFRAITWNLLLDCFPCRIPLKRDPVASISSITYLVDDVETTVDSDSYYLKKLTQYSEIVLEEDEDWPTDGDDREQSITVQFVTEGYYRQDSIIQAIMRMVAYWYRNRGDCPDCDSAAKGSCAKMMFDQFRIVRV